MLLTLNDDEAEDAIRIESDGTPVADGSVVASLVARALGLDAAPRIAVTMVDYAQSASGEPVPSTRTATGIYWIPDGHDHAMMGTWTLDGSAFTVVEQGLVEPPVAQDPALIARATSAVASGYADGRVVEAGLASATVRGSVRCIRVFVLRDARVTRPEDLLSTEEMSRLRDGSLGFATVLDIGGGKAIVRKHEC